MFLKKYFMNCTKDNYLLVDKYVGFSQCMILYLCNIVVYFIAIIYRFIVWLGLVYIVCHVLDKVSLVEELYYYRTSKGQK